MKKLTAYILFILLGLVLSVPSAVRADNGQAQTDSQKSAQKSYKQYQKDQKKLAKQQAKAQKKTQKEWANQHQVAQHPESQASR